MRLLHSLPPQDMFWNIIWASIPNNQDPHNYRSGDQSGADAWASMVVQRVIGEATRLQAQYHCRDFGKSPSESSPRPRVMDPWCRAALLVCRSGFDLVPAVAAIQAHQADPSQPVLLVPAPADKQESEIPFPLLIFSL